MIFHCYVWTLRCKSLRNESMKIPGSLCRIRSMSRSLSTRRLGGAWQKDDRRQATSVMSSRNWKSGKVRPPLTAALRPWKKNFAAPTFWANCQRNPSPHTRPYPYSSQPFKQQSPTSSLKPPRTSILAQNWKFRDVPVETNPTLSSRWRETGSRAMRDYRMRRNHSDGGGNMSEVWRFALRFDNTQFLLLMCRVEWSFGE